MKMYRIYKFLLPLLVVATVFTSFKAPEKSPKDKVLLTILEYVLTQGHYQPHQLDNAFSANVFDLFIERLDPTKRYFLQADINEFDDYKYQIDDQIKDKDLTFFYLVHNRLQQRVKEAEEMYEYLIEKPFNFEVEETLDVDYDKLKYSKSSKQLANLWRKQLKLNTLSRLNDMLEDEDEKIKEDTSYKKRSLKELEKEARGKTKESMDNFFDRMDELTYEDWFSTFLNCVAEEFDPHTTYFSPNFKKKFDIEMAGKLEGIGARLQKVNDYTKVVEIISGGPAWKQGDLEVGDLILKVAQGNDEPIDIVGMRLDDAIEFIKGKKGTEARLTVKKLDGSYKVISITRDVVELEETFVKSSVVDIDDKKLGVIHLPKFYTDFDDKKYRNSATDMEQELKRLKLQGVEGVVLDLRNNGGGSLQTAIEITGLFIDKGPVVQVKFRDREADVRKDKDSKVVWDGPLVVLVNELSASASEIFAAAMQDYGRAVVIGGKHTYGKGTVQSVLDLNRYHNLDEDLGALKMTIQKFYRINGSSTQLKGVESDIKLPSRYTYMDIGERDLTNPLPYDKVKKLDYNTWNNYKNFNQVVTNSINRVSTNKYFKLIDNHAKWLKQSNEDTLASLNLKTYQEDLENHQNMSEKFSALKDFTTDFTFNSPQYELTLLTSNEDLKEKRDRWHANLKKDIYMAEALQVLSELELKPNYHLV
ncbi:MAG TPA: carboxy terminal-processing peptidase, partial [Flavobacteriaceae bacterium]|nr:carboxy terminal-processing peptidase [Flavobacteriaceae bacterium]